MTPADATLDRNDAVGCGRCSRPVPTGAAHLIVNWHAPGHHQLFCDRCCPCHTQPVVPWRGPLSR